MSDKPRVYMAGPVMAKDDGGHGWRDRLADLYPQSIDWVNPLDKYDGHSNDVVVVNQTDVATAERVAPDKEVVGHEELVEADIDLLRGCDAVLVGWERVPSVGTPMEVVYAHIHDIPVVLYPEPDMSDVVDMPDPGHNISPWMYYHADEVALYEEEIVSVVYEMLK